jgi:hypothetical protein
MDFVLKRNRDKGNFGKGGGGGGSYPSDTVVRLRGLPYSCSNEDITKFFQGMAARSILTRTKQLSTNTQSFQYLVLALRHNSN